ncbi:MAG TPA: hypothetical protein VJM15_11065 [Sphingomicrobium sp.]|nr:hypothetical protein [Sphingomicrobium sp.]
MKALKIMIAGGVAATALFAAAPAAAQYYPGPGYGYPGYGSPYGGNVVGQVLNQVLGGGQYGQYGYGANSQMAVNQCAAAVQQRLSGGYGYNPYGGYNNAYGGGARVLGISRVEPRSNGGLTVRGVASSGMYAGYGAYGYNNQGQVDLTWKCKVDYRGFVSDIDIDRASRVSGYNYQTQPYQPYNPYAQYGYRRY